MTLLPDQQKIAGELRATRKGKTLNRGASTLRKLNHEGHRYEVRSPLLEPASVQGCLFNCPKMELPRPRAVHAPHPRPPRVSRGLSMDSLHQFTAVSPRTQEEQLNPAKKSANPVAYFLFQLDKMEMSHKSGSFLPHRHNP